jgi:hypothetical protein
LQGLFKWLWITAERVRWLRYTRSKPCSKPALVSSERHAHRSNEVRNSIKVSKRALQCCSIEVLRGWHSFGKICSKTCSKGSTVSENRQPCGKRKARTYTDEAFALMSALA